MHEAEWVYAAMAIPFHIAVFNEYLVTALAMLQDDGQAVDAGQPHKLMLGPLRGALSAAGMTMPQDQDKVMNFAQKLRNTIVHDGAVARAGIVGIWNELSPQQRAVWVEDAGQPRTWWPESASILAQARFAQPSPSLHTLREP